MRPIFYLPYTGKKKPDPPGSGPSAFVLGDWQYSFPGYEASLKAGQTVTVNKATIIDSISRYNQREAEKRHRPPKDLVAHICDYILWLLSQVENGMDLLAGELLARLKERGLQKIGCHKITDFGREELGMAATVTYELMRHSTGLKKYPLLNAAYAMRKINKSQLDSLLQIFEICRSVMDSEVEQLWVTIAKGHTVRGLREICGKFKKQVKEALAGGKRDSGRGSPSEDRLPAPALLRGSPLPPGEGQAFSIGNNSPLKPIRNMKRHKSKKIQGVMGNNLPAWNSIANPPLFRDVAHLLKRYAGPG